MGTETTFKAEDWRRFWTFGQDCWSSDISEYDIPGTNGGVGGYIVGKEGGGREDTNSSDTSDTTDTSDTSDTTDTSDTRASAG